MNLPDDLKARIDEYLDGTLNSTDLQALESALVSDPAARAYFVRYAQLHGDLGQEARASRAAAAAIRKLAGITRTPFRRPVAWIIGSVIALLFAVALGWVLHKPAAPEPSAIAWLVNAQDCTWTDGKAPDDGLKPGTLLSIDRGLAEIRFRSGARVILSGPARLELRSENAATLYRGRATARVPEPAIGFELLSPKGKIIDLGTEFGVEVGEDGATGIYVFEGAVSTVVNDGRSFNMTEHEVARIEANEMGPFSVGNIPADHPFVRAIVPPPVVVARTKSLDFRQPVPATVRDRTGRGTGFTHRLKSTGFALPADDPNLPESRPRPRTDDDEQRHQWPVQTRNRNTSVPPRRARSPGPRILKSPPTSHTSRLYVGAGSSGCMLGRAVPATSGRVDQQGRRDVHAEPREQLPRAGHGFGLRRPVLDRRRPARYPQTDRWRYAMTVENRTRGSTVTLTTKQPNYLDGMADLHVGIFGANTQSDEPKTLAVREVRATVWKSEPAR